MKLFFLCVVRWNDPVWLNFKWCGWNHWFWKLHQMKQQKSLVTLVCSWGCKTTHLYEDYEIFNRNPYQSTRITRDVRSPVLDSPVLTIKWQINNNVRLSAIQDITVTLYHCISEQLFKDFHCFNNFFGRCSTERKDVYCPFHFGGPPPLWRARAKNKSFM